MLFEDVTLWIEAQFFIAHRHPDRKFNRLRPGAFVVREKSLDRFYKFMQYCKAAYDEFDTPFRRWEAYNHMHPEDHNKLNRTYDWVYVWFTTGSRKFATRLILKQCPYYGDDFSPPYNPEVARHIIGELFVESPRHWNNSWETLFKIFRKGKSNGKF